MDSVARVLYLLGELSRLYEARKQDDLCARTRDLLQFLDSFSDECGITSLPTTHVPSPRRIGRSPLRNRSASPELVDERRKHVVVNIGHLRIYSSDEYQLHLLEVIEDVLLKEILVE